VEVEAEVEVMAGVEVMAEVAVVEVMAVEVMAVEVMAAGVGTVARSRVRPLSRAPTVDRARWLFASTHPEAQPKI
jgi:hypothetical protein